MAVRPPKHEDPNYRPNEYREILGQTELHLKYRLFKLLDNPPPYMGKEDNIFSVVLEIAWYGLKQNMLQNDDDLEKLKFRLIRRLVEKNIDEEKIYVLLDFISLYLYLPFADKKKETIFEQNIELLINEDNMLNFDTMTIREYLVEKTRIAERKAIKRDMKKLEKQRDELEVLRKEEEVRRKEEEVRRKEEEISISNAIVNLYKRDFSPEMIADVMSKPMPFIQEVLDKFIHDSKG